MKHYIKTVTGVKYTPMFRSDYDNKNWQIYAQPGQKYRVWDFFIVVCFPYYRTKIAKERLWKESYIPMPDKYELYTDADLKGFKQLIVKEDGSLWNMPKVVVTLSDGTVETHYYDSNNEAETVVNKLIDEWNLKLFNIEKV